jgi:hypothetical protein
MMKSKTGRKGNYICAICVDLIKHRLTSREARRNLNELASSLEGDSRRIFDETHAEEVFTLIEQQELLERVSTG